MGSLPNIKIGPVHTVHLRVMDKEIHFVPFTVSQEKGILNATNAIEENISNTKDIINNYISIAKSCVQEELDWEKISLIDFMTISIFLRAKSQGEVISLQKKECEKCKKSYPFDVNIEESLIFDNVENFKKIIKIDDILSIEIVPLKINYLYDFDNLKNELDFFVSMISHSISKIFFKDEIYTNLSIEDIKTNCVDNLTKFQLKKINTEFDKLISLRLALEMTCPHCQNKERQSITNFLEF